MTLEQLLMVDKKPRKMSTLEWAEAHRIIPFKVERFRNSITPFPVIVYKKSVQIGWSKLMNRYIDCILVKDIAKEQELGE